MMGTKLATLNVVDITGWIDFHLKPRLIIPIPPFANGRPIVDQPEPELKDIATEVCKLYLEQQFHSYNPSLKITEGKDKDKNMEYYVWWEQ